MLYVKDEEFAKVHRDLRAAEARLAQARAHITELLAYIDLHQEVCMFDTKNITAARNFVSES